MRVLLESGLGAIRLERKPKAFFILHIPLGAPDNAADRFMEGRKEAENAIPSVLGNVLPTGSSREELRLFCKNTLEKYIDSVFPDLLEKSQEKNVEWEIGCAHGAWAKCHTGNRVIHFHGALCWMPPRVVDEVILHELNHFRCMDHSPAFWQRMNFLEPDWPYLEGYLRNTKEGVPHVFPV